MTDANEARVVVVTGVGSTGLGLAIARAFLDAGDRVVAINHPDRRDDLDQAVDLLRRTADETIGLALDITDEAAVGQGVAQALGWHGRLDVLVNNAGMMLRKDIFSTTVAEWRHVLDVNVTGAWLMSRACGRHLCDQGSGSVINVSSVYADRVGQLPESAYYASKAAVSNLTRALAAEFGPMGVTVNCVAPGVFFPTDMTRPLEESPETLATMTRRSMLGRLGDPDRDLHGVVLFLASTSARYVTGQTVYVDGGWSAW